MTDKKFLPIPALSREKIKQFQTEKNPENLLRFLMDDRADLITFIESSYQSNELVEMLSKNSIHLMGYVIKAASQGKNSWNDSKVINWMEENVIDILTIAEMLRVDYLNYNLSPKVEDRLFQLLVEDHVIYKDGLLEKPLDNSYKIVKYLKTFPISYIKKFQEVDSEFLNDLMKMPIEPSFYNLAQQTYIERGQAGKKEEAQYIFNTFTYLILSPVCKKINGYTIKTDICEYFLKDADQLETWEFFGSMDYKKLNDNQKEVYLATGISHLFNESNRPLRSRNYSQEDVMNALMIVPRDRLEYYIKANHTKMAKRTGDELLSLWMKNHLENNLAPSPKVKGIKI